MKLRIIILVVVCLSAVGAIWTGFMVWDSYADPNYQRHWSGDFFQAAGTVEGRWIEEGGAINAGYSGRDDTQILYPLTGDFSKFVRSEWNPKPLDIVRDGAFTEMRIYTAEDLWKWYQDTANMSPKEIEANHPLHIYATRCWSFPLYWIPPALLFTTLAGTLMISRLIRRMRTIFSLLSFMTAAIFVALWCRSFVPRWPTDAVTYGRETAASPLTLFEVSADNGHVVFGVQYPQGMSGRSSGWDFGRSTMRGGLPKGSVFGFGFERYEYHGIDDSATGRFASLPIWLPLLMTLIAPGLLVRRVFRQFRRKPNQCEVCGYDLRATPERCPECGTVANVAKSA